MDNGGLSTWFDRKAVSSQVIWGHGGLGAQRGVESVFRLEICSNPNPLASGVRGATYVCFGVGFGLGFGLACVGWGWVCVVYGM